MRTRTTTHSALSERDTHGIFALLFSLGLSRTLDVFCTVSVFSAISAFSDGTIESADQLPDEYSRLAGYAD